MQPPDQTNPSMLPLPIGADAGFWKSEVQRSQEKLDRYKTEYQENIDWYKGESPDWKNAKKKTVNVNVDFYQVEQKLAQLFYDQPDLQLSVKGALAMKAQMPPLMGPGQSQPANADQTGGVIQAHRAILNELLSDEHADVLSTVHRAIKECLCVSGVGPVVLGYQPTVRRVEAPQQPGSILGLNQPMDVPIYEQWYADSFSTRKLLRPADFTSTDWDAAPWLGYRLRLTLPNWQREFPDIAAQNPTFIGTTDGDQYVNNSKAPQDTTSTKYVDLVVIWYRAAHFEQAPVHPELYRELVLTDGLEGVSRHRDSPHQTFNGGRLSGDSLIGNPIHPLSIRFVPDDAYTPSDSQMTRSLVQELCKFRTQMVQERDATRPRWGFDTGKLAPEAVTALTNGELGDLIPLEEGALATGVQSIIAQLVQPSTRRENYTANDYVTRDIEKTLAIDATGAGVDNQDDATATKTATVDRNRAVRLDAERREVLRWYLKLVYKMSALVCRYMTPDLAAQWIGPEQAQVWGQWDKTASDGRVSFKAKPDSQIRLDAAQERRFALQLYQMTANDPNVVRVELLRNLFEKSGYDPSKLLVQQVPQSSPKPALGFTFKGDDLNPAMPQAAIVREILADCGIQISQQSVDAAGSQAFKQATIGLAQPPNTAFPPARNPAGHGGPATQVRGLSKQQGDETGDRPGPKTGEAA